MQDAEAAACQLLMTLKTRWLNKKCLCPKNPSSRLLHCAPVQGSLCSILSCDDDLLCEAVCVPC